MVQNRYITDYSNQVHQLIVSVSRHFYITADGKLKYQKKPFEAKLGHQDSYSKRHLIHYMIRDHFSGLFYAEISDTNDMYPVLEFLYRAWSRKDLHPLHGLPDAVTVPKNLRVLWPTLVPFLEKEAIEPIDVTSGFQGGVRDIRTWEQELRFYPYMYDSQPDYMNIREKAEIICAKLNTSEIRGGHKSTVWMENLCGNVRVPTSWEGFHDGKSAAR